MLEILEVVLEAQQMALHMIAASLMMRSCGTYSGMIRAPFLLGTLKSGDGEMKECLNSECIVIAHMSKDDLHRPFHCFKCFY